MKVLYASTLTPPALGSTLFPFSSRIISVLLLLLLVALFRWGDVEPRFVSTVVVISLSLLGCVYRWWWLNMAKSHGSGQWCTRSEWLVNVAVSIATQIPPEVTTAIQAQGVEVEAMLTPSSLAPSTLETGNGSGRMDTLESVAGNHSGSSGEPRRRHSGSNGGDRSHQKSVSAVEIDVILRQIREAHESATLITKVSGGAKAQVTLPLSDDMLEVSAKLERIIKKQGIKNTEAVQFCSALRDVRAGISAVSHCTQRTLKT